MTALLLALGLFALVNVVVWWWSGAGAPRPREPTRGRRMWTDLVIPALGMAAMLWLCGLMILQAFGRGE